MPFTLLDLPYAFNSLEPHIDAKTMEIHHDKHHKAYVDNLNKALEGNEELSNMQIEDLLMNLASVPEAIKITVKNNAGGHFNHSFFWPLMSASGGGVPQEKLGAAITQAFGSFDAFKEQFTKAALGRFGSGWAWLSVDSKNGLFISSTPNQDSPLSDGFTPVLGLDVWEHAYYLNYQNRRADYIAGWWNVVNWIQAESNYLQALK